ncbi:MAG TPA: hypothetical protein VLH86_00165 [Patescibacteria group bacterium]|nr:hypothetical protein [Patescibacteria group bacterium]
MAQTDDVQADGYYAEDDMGDDALDLSFLDEKESDESEPEQKK